MTDRPGGLSRRSVNAFLASAVVWPCNRAGSQLAPNQPEPLTPQHMLLSLFGNPRSASEIGAACLKSLPPDQNSRQQLTNTILGAAGCDIETMKARQAVKRRIANQVRYDFAEGIVISVDGWLLSLTEARLYALVALCSKPACLACETRCSPEIGRPVSQ
jgi:hypothetical protein